MPLNHFGVFFQRLLKYLLLISLGLMSVALFYKDKLPPPHVYQHLPLKSPLQQPTERGIFTVKTERYNYIITPKFDYELTGVVVSYSNADGFTNIWHHKRWKDFINVRDLCVVWGKNVRSGVYQHVAFRSDSWTCWASWEKGKWGRVFQGNAISNNHLLTNNEAIKSALLQAHIGDVIHFKGVLADYKNEGAHTARATSTTREDSGNGACEIVYLDEFAILKKANAGWRILYSLSKWVAILSFSGLLIFMGILPHRPY